MNDQEAHKMVRNGYGKIAKANQSSCGCGCGSATNVSQQVGYTKTELDAVPKGADLNLGCGNPTAHASLKEGEIVIDLGSGGGLDCFLAAKKVGPTGKVIGVDMTPEMIDRARTNLAKSKDQNVEFRLGEIENLPVADNTADVIISNCVINLSPNKKRVFEEAFRVLKPKGRMMISDMVLTNPIPKALLENVAAYIGCISGAEIKTTYLERIKQAGFTDVQVVEESTMPVEALLSEETTNEILAQLEMSKEEANKLFGAAVSLKVSAFKP